VTQLSHVYIKQGHLEMTLKDQMKGKIPEPLLPMVPKRFEIIGDIAVLSIPPKLDNYKIDIARMVASKRKNIKTVLNKVAMLQGETRVGKYETLLGSDTETVHKEYGYLYRLDVRNVFFNTRLSSERLRVASKITSYEDVLIPFCGVGPFAVLAASQKANVIAVEKNAEACRWLAENVQLNKVDDNVSIIHGDATHITNMIKGSFDRTIVPIPYGRDHFLWDILELIKKGGVIHFYTFKKQNQIPDLIKSYQDNGLNVIFYRRCGNVAPGVSRWVFDLIKQ
jgi:tRNA (guanine37-N1)-methyltransferase